MSLIHRTFSGLVLACAISVNLYAAQTPAYLESYQRYVEALQARDYEQAKEFAGQAYGQAKDVLEDDSEELFHLHSNFGKALRNTHRNSDAKHQLAGALARAKNIFGEESDEYIDSLLLLGAVKAEHGKKLPREVRTAEKLAKIYYADKPEKMAGIRLHLGQQFATLGQTRKAKNHLTSALEAFETLHGEGSAELARTNFWLGKVELALGRRTQARDYFLASTSSHSPVAMSAHAFLVGVYEELGESKQATKHCQIIGANRPFNANQQQVPLYITPPDYPRQAQTKGQEGEVIVSYTLDEQGFVRDPKVIETTRGRMFNKAALAALEKWRFAPRFEDGEAVPTAELRHRITFELY